jgi:hypothetical protein
VEFSIGDLIMIRGIRVGLALASALAILAAGRVHAQYGFGFGYGAYPDGYGAYGWGGWGSTVDGDIARGLGYYNIGAGSYNLDTAKADAIDTDTVMRWNDYLFQSQQLANIREHRRIAQRAERDKIAYEANLARLRSDPTPVDIAGGNALNALLDQLTDPKVHSSSLRLATAKIPGSLVRTIPFVNASEAISISLDQLTSDDSWPIALLDSKFDDDRRAYIEAIDKALEEDMNGEISRQTLQKVQDILSRLRTKLNANPPADKAQYAEATQYLKTLAGMTRLLQKPKVEKIIAELEKIKETTLGNLLGFMGSFNLRFGRAMTPEQRKAYEQLYPLLVEHRDRILKDEKATAKSEARPKAERPTDFFRGMHLDHQEDKKSDSPDKK